MSYYFKQINDELHLYEKKLFKDDDLGALKKTMTGKLKTTNFFGEKFELEDISGIFSKGERYRIESSKGMHGVLIKHRFSDEYEYEEEKGVK